MDIKTIARKICGLLNYKPQILVVSNQFIIHIFFQKFFIHVFDKNMKIIPNLWIYVKSKIV